MPVNNDILNALKALPLAHRRSLATTPPRGVKWPKGVRSQEARLEHLASVFKAKDLARYTNLYLPSARGLFTWYLDRDVDDSIDRIAKRCLQAHHGVGAGLEPDVSQGDPPKLHQMIQRGNQIELVYAVAGLPRQIEDGWELRTVEHIRLLRAVLRQNPFTIEMRGVPRNFHSDLMNALTDDLDLDMDPETCDLDTEELQDDLGDAIEAMEIGVHELGNGNAHLGHTTIFTDEEISIHDQDDYKEQRKHQDRRELFSRTFKFYTQHPDGYNEKAHYMIKVSSGELRVSTRISELATNNLRQHVIELF
jgi:hypothetical protein